MGKISVLINVVAQEVHFLPQVLASVKDFADEIVLVDMSDGEEVGKVASEFGALVFPHEFVNYVEPARNFGIQKATGEWILVLDPDEEIQGPLVSKLKQVVDSDAVDYLRVPRKNIVFGKWLKHSRWWPDYNIRFFKKGHVTWNEVIHAVPMTIGRGADLVDEEENAIIHHHYASIEQFIERMNRYTGVQARLKVGEGYKFHWSDLIKKPVAEFVSRYYAGKGYHDGVHGLALSLLQGVSELVLYLKIWQEEKFTAESLDTQETGAVLREAQKEMNYWRADAEVNEGGGFLSKIRRKLKL